MWFKAIEEDKCGSKTPYHRNRNDWFVPEQKDECSFFFSRVCQEETHMMSDGVARVTSPMRTQVWTQVCDHTFPKQRRAANPSGLRSKPLVGLCSLFLNTCVNDSGGWFLLTTVAVHGTVSWEANYHCSHAGDFDTAVPFLRRAYWYTADCRMFE